MNQPKLPEELCVGLEVLAVPDGVVLNKPGTKPKLKLSLVLSFSEATVGRPRVDLAEWPAPLNTLLNENLRIHVGKYDRSNGTLIEDSLQTINVGKNPEDGKIIAQHSDEDLLIAHNLFKKIFEPDAHDREFPNLSHLHKKIISQTKVARVENKVPSIQKLASPSLAKFYKEQLQIMLTANIVSMSAEKIAQTKKFDIEKITTSADFWKNLSDKVREQQQLFEDTFFAPTSSEITTDSLDDFIERVTIVYAETQSSTFVKTASQLPEAWYMELRLPQIIDEYRQDKPLSITKLSQTDLVEELANYKLFGVYNYASLAKFLGLIVDLEIELPVDQWPDTDNEEWVVAGVIQSKEDEISQNTIWSAFELTAGKTSSFYPKPHPEADLGEGYFSQNVINLNIATSLREPRFALESIDIKASFMFLENQLKTVEAKFGTKQLKSEKSVPEIFDRGIGLYDSDVDGLLSRQDERDNALQESLKNGKLLVKYAEDLMTGMRLMIKVSSVDDVTKGKWMPANNRKHIFTDIPEEYREKIQPFSLRDSGQIQEITQKLSSKVSEVNDLIVSWLGEGLSLPVELGKFVVEADKGINTNLTIGANDNQMPPLREGLYYQFGAYPVYIHGGSLNFDHASKIIEDNRYGLGGQGDRNKAFHYISSASLKAPTILIDPKDKYIGENESSYNYKGDSTETLIFRKNLGKPSRYIIPPRVSFDLAEQASAFDKSTSNNPPGSFFTSPRLRMNNIPGADASFPILNYKGGIVYPSFKEETKSRGIVYIETRKAGDSSKDYFPDPAIKGMNLKLVRQSDKILLGDVGDIGFYENDEPDISKALSWNLKVEAWDNSSARISRHPSENKITIFLAPAEELLLYMYSKPFEGTQRTLLKIIKDHVPGALLAPNDYVDGLHRHNELKLVYAVKAPIREPVIDADSFKAVVIRYENDNSWSEYITNPDNYRDQDISDSSKLISENMGGKTFFIGDLDVHRNSTQAVRIEMQWKDFAQVKKNGDEYVEQFMPNETSIFVNDVEPSSESNNSGLSITYSDADVESETVNKFDQGKLRGLSFDFVNPTARRLIVRSVALSRFRSHFEGKIHDDCKDADFELYSSPIEAWVPATKRPDKVEFVRSVKIENTFLLEKNYAVVDATKAGTKYFERKCSTYRVWLDNWYSSGEDEKLAILLWQNGDTTAELNARFNDVADGPTDKVTRWAADPIVLSGALDDLVEEKRFSNYELRKNLKLPNVKNDIRVSALIYEVHFSKEYGKWYCDIDFEPAASYQHWLHLSLARYQEHAVEGFQLSEPVSHKVWWPSAVGGKVVTVKGRNSGSVVIQLDGIGYKKKSPITEMSNADSREVQSKLNTPILRLSYMLKDSQRIPAEEWALELESGKVKNIVEIEPTDFDNDRVRWIHKLDREDWPELSNVGVLLELLDYHPIGTDGEISSITKFAQLIELKS